MGAEQQIWNMLHSIQSTLGLHRIGFQGVVRSPESQKASGFMLVPDLDIGLWGSDNLKKLAALAPGSLLMDIADGNIRKSFQLSLPATIFKFPEICCKNEACVSHPDNGQREVTTYFIRVQGQDGGWRWVCKYCETPHDPMEIWNRKTTSY